MLPAEWRKRILQLAGAQFGPNAKFDDGRSKAGMSLHQIDPATGKGIVSEQAEQLKLYGDDHLWLIMNTARYLRETGDFSILDEMAQFCDEGKATLYKHLAMSLEVTKNNCDPETGIPYSFFADWNDCLRLPKGSVSVFLADMYVNDSMDMSEIASYLGKPEEAVYYQKMASDMKANINKYCMDKLGYYIRAIMPGNHKVGSSENQEGTAFLEPQVWGVISGTANAERAEVISKFVKEKMFTKYGIQLIKDPYTKKNPEGGDIPIYFPGIKEQGGFAHAHSWAIKMECMLGHGELAYEYFLSTLPLIIDTDIHKTEKHVYSQTIDLDQNSEDFGTAKNSHLTGTAAWMYVAQAQEILGIKPKFNGLQIDPCITKKWSGFKATYKFRGATNKISVENPDRICKGVKQMFVDDKEIAPNEKGEFIIPDFKEGVHNVRVIMG